MTGDGRPRTVDRRQLEQLERLERLEQRFRLERLEQAPFGGVNRYALCKLLELLERLEQSLPDDRGP